MADRKAQLRENLAATRAEIERLSAQADRKPPQLLPVTKFHPAADIALLAELLSLIHISEPTRRS